MTRRGESAPAAEAPVTLVTGASRGLGRAIALRLAEAGHHLVLAYHRDADAAEAVALACRAAGAASGIGATTVRADLAVPDQVAELFEAARSFAATSGGVLSGVVNNAGAAVSVGPLAKAEPEELRRDLDVNLFSVVLCCREASRTLGDGGAIVNVSSVAARLGGPHTYVHYAAAKAGVEALTRGLARELGPHGVRVNAVAPGTLWTEFHADPQRPAAVAPSVPLGRAGQPEEVAGAVAWLLSPEASYTNGAVLEVSGGL